MRNKDVHQRFKESGVRKWKVAEKLGLNDGNFSRKLRKELSQTEKDEIYRVIEELKAKQSKGREVE